MEAPRQVLTQHPNFERKQVMELAAGNKQDRRHGGCRGRCKGT